MKTGGKLHSGQDLEIQLKQNDKLVTSIKGWSHAEKPVVVAFKLTDTQDTNERQAAVDKLLSSAQIDAVVWNDLSEISAKRHCGRIFMKAGDGIPFSTKAELAEKLAAQMEKGRNAWYSPSM